MKHGAKNLFFVLAVVVSLLTVSSARAQALPTGSSTNFSSVSYFEPPNEQKVKLKVSGAEMSSLPGMTYDVKKLKIEEFGTNGTLKAVAVAPQCIYSPMEGVASSPGPLDLTLAEGRLHLQGEGFLWQQNELSLVISNRVRTVINVGTWKLTTP